MAEYATIIEVKQSLGIAVDDTAKDDLLKQIMPSATAAINTYIGRDLRATEHEELLDGRGRQFVFTSYFPIIEIDSIVDNDYGTETTLDETDYIVYNACGKIQLNPDGAIISRFTPRPQGVEVTYTAGYEVIPDDVKYAYIELVGMWSGLKTRTIVMNDGTVMEGVKAPAGQIPKELKLILDPYKKVRV